ncbi:STAS domain-containing protein [Amycolatopsis thermalba]|uniref:Anti-sigma factor antagonist n=1 Tax=Amycolatopsis thermalba TaxID=944492 RepID=A0ABY4NVQ3_9PSEU|nr:MULTISPECIES: STAS domain-containing protein [Amycolatopsis]UQS24160.1 STAS domain-containing protein [Amycolatopsis thermalba]
MSEAHELRIDVTDRADGIRLARLTGELDLVAAPALRDLLTRCLDDGRTFILDLEAITFLGSAGLQALVDTDDAAAERNVRWALAGSHRVVIRPLEVTGLHEQLPLYPSVTVAARHLAEAAQVAG